MQLWGGLVAIANQFRVSEGLSTLDGPSQTLPMLYSFLSSSNYANEFHDITSGSNFYDLNGNQTQDPGESTAYYAGTGYDLVTGIGTPQANNLVPAFAENGITQWGTICA